MTADKRINRRRFLLGAAQAVTAAALTGCVSGQFSQMGTTVSRQAAADVSVAVRTGPLNAPPLLRPLSPREPDLRRLSLDHKIGQMLLMGFRGRSVSGDSHVIRSIEEQHVGGVVLFAHNVSSPDQLSALNSTLQAYALQNDSLPLLIAIDQEGGRVNRLNSSFGIPRNLSAQQLGALDDEGETFAYARLIARSLRDVGVNLNLAPVVDLNTNARNPVIGAVARSFSADPDVVTRQARAFIRAHREEGILTTLKHFPGHGSSADDSHFGFVDVTESWDESELRPYEEIISAGECDAVMTAHIFNSRLDAELPATLSRLIISGILRDRFQYDGLILTDDLQMNAIRKFYTFEEAVRLALDAGVDIFSISNNSVFERNAPIRFVETVKRLVTSGTVSPERIDISYRRILRAKQRLGVGALAARSG